MPDFLKEAAEIADRIIAIRRRIHSRPELGRHEIETGKTVRDTLESLGLEVHTCAETGLYATLTGSYPGPMIGLRADMDALPITEDTGLEYQSIYPGIMHACGHDIHTAALLGAAMLLCAHKESLHGSVRFLFQPDEEGDGGAQRMVDQGALSGVSCIFGTHTAPELKSGTVGVRYGNAYAASNPFDITIRGRSCHGAEPHLGADAITAASQIVVALQSIVSRNTSPLDSAVLSIGSFHAGTARNIIADEARISGVIRCFGHDARRMMIDRVTAITNGICSAMGVESDLRFVWGYSGVINCTSETDLVHEVLTEMLGPENVIIEPVPSMTTEDFGAFLDVVPGSYWHIGVGYGDQPNYPLHNPHYAPDERSLLIAAAAHARIAFTKLK